MSKIKSITLKEETCFANSEESRHFMSFDPVFLLKKFVCLPLVFFKRLFVDTNRLEIFPTITEAKVPLVGCRL